MARSTWFVAAATVAAVALLAVAVGVRLVSQDDASTQFAVVGRTGDVRFISFSWADGVVDETARFPDLDDEVVEVLVQDREVVLLMASGEVRLITEDRLVARVVWTADRNPDVAVTGLINLESGWGLRLSDGTYRRSAGDALRPWVPAVEIAADTATGFGGLVAVVTEQQVLYFEPGAADRRRTVPLPFGFDPVRIHGLDTRMVIQSRGGVVAYHDMASGATTVVDNSAARWRRTPVIGPGGWSAVSLSDEATVLIQDGVRTIAYQSSRLAQSVHGRPDLVVLTFADGAVVVVDPEQRRQPVAVLPGEVDAVWAGVLANET